VDARGYVQLTLQGRFQEALQLVRQRLPFPGILGYVCVHPCEFHCKRIDTDEAVRIRDIKRFLAEWEQGDPQHILECDPARDARVAVVGAGPAGLLAAHDLRRRGYRVEVFEREQRIGGCLRYRIPEWRLPSAVRDRDLSVIDALGIELRTGCELGRDIKLEDLCATYHAVLLLVGYGGGQRLLDRDSLGFERTGRDTMWVDPLTCETGIEGVFAGGDAATGPATVIHALAWGRRAAESAHRFLTGHELRESRESQRPEALLWQLDVDEAERKRRERPPVMLRPSEEPLSEKEVLEESERCLDCSCNRCVEECEFLERHCESPRDLARQLRSGPDEHLAMIYRCNLCGLCREVCPVELDTGEMLQEARRQAVRAGVGPLPQHRPEVRFHRLGVSRAFTLAMPAPGRQRVRRLFFTGCSLPGTAPDATLQLYRELCLVEPGTGVLMHCCGVPAMALGMEEEAREAVRLIEERIESFGAEELVVVCPGCQHRLAGELDHIRISTVWELMADRWTPPAGRADTTVTVHDPCSARHNPELQRAVRGLVRAVGGGVEELEYSGGTTRCCGLGGRIAPVDPSLAADIGRRRASECEHPVVTYCASCRSALHRAGAESIDLVEFLLARDVEAAMRRKPQSRLMRYFNRLRLKRAFLRMRSSESA
jgi:NADPH-dependent glutamate synthase beta subunit-like oxidoreductase